MVRKVQDWNACHPNSPGPIRGEDAGGVRGRKRYPREEKSTKSKEGSLRDFTSRLQALEGGERYSSGNRELDLYGGAEGEIEDVNSLRGDSSFLG